jgi:hypothetical protein
MYYIFLGHVARWLGWPLVFAFHFFRVLFSGLLIVLLFRFCAAMFVDKSVRWLAFILAALGSGVGWLALPFGLFTSDLWVAETYPFLAAYANAHFPVGLSLQLWLLTPKNEDEFDLKRGLGLALFSLLEAVVSPFGMVVVIVAWGGVLVWRFLRKELWQALFWRVAVMGAVSGPFMLYYYWIGGTHPTLSVWNAQNLTLSPPWWDLLISLSPVLLLGLYGAWLALRGKETETHLLAVWLLACLLLIAVPFSLQRRFLQGLYIPAALLTALAVAHILQSRPRFRVSLIALLFFFSLPTNIVVLLTSFFGAQTLEPKLYLTQGEAQAFAWIEEHTSPHEVLLAAPETGLFVPVYTHAWVLYGHPYETVDAQVREALVTSFFDGSLTQAREMLEKYGVDYVFVGPRENALGDAGWLAEFPVVFQAGDVTLYRVGE